MMDLRAITHEFAPGADRRMPDGGRHVRDGGPAQLDRRLLQDLCPPARRCPGPTRSPKATSVEQAVSLTRHGLAARARQRGDGADPRRSSATRSGRRRRSGSVSIPTMRGERCARADAARARRRAISSAISIRAAATTARRSPPLSRSRRALGATPWLEAVVAEVDGFEAEIAALGAHGRASARRSRSVLVSPASDLKCTLPGSVWPPCPPAAALYRAARRAFPGARLGGGMFSYFTELNRKRPPLAELDFVSFTTSRSGPCRRRPLGDRKSGIAAAYRPQRARHRRATSPTPSARAPSACATIPTAQATAANPDNIRQAMNRNDPRQRGLLGAAWSARLFRAFRARRGAARSRSAAPSARSGCASRPPIIRSRGSTSTAGSIPAFHVAARACATARRADARGGDLRAARSSGFCGRRRALDRQPYGRAAPLRFGASGMSKVASRGSTPKVSSPPRTTSTRSTVSNVPLKAARSNSTPTPCSAFASPDDAARYRPIARSISKRRGLMLAELRRLA